MPHHIWEGLSERGKHKCVMRQLAAHLLLPFVQATALIGSGGAVVRQMQDETGAKLDISTTKLTVVIVGGPEQVSAAKILVEKKIKEAKSRPRAGGAKKGASRW